ncbi:histidine kinase [Opitutaceae bacterium TAV5]|nr:histidine kinase [Opitutaceae bacterium TAV5]
MTLPLRFLHSIRWRVQAWHGLILLFAIAAFCFTAHRLAWNNHLRRIDAVLVENEKKLVRGIFELASPSDLAERPPPDVLFTTLAREGRLTVPPSLAAVYEDTSPGYYWFSFREGGENGKTLLPSPNLPGDVVLPPDPGETDAEELHTEKHRRIVHHRFRNGLLLTFGRDLTPDLDDSRRFAWSLAGCGLAVWLLGLLGGWWLAGRAIRPIEAISRTASRIAEGNLSERINVTDTDNELDQLGRVLNETFDRLAATFERQRRFTADASHELRTPVTILLSETQRILKRDRTPAEYREALQTCGETATRMRRLIEALLLLARQETASAGGAHAHHEPCDLAAILDEAAAHLAPLAADRGITFHADLQPAQCRGDPAALSILVTNLLTNALQHHHATGGGHVHLRSGTRDGEAVIMIRDDGPGIPAEDLPHIFERFYRADKARTGGDPAAHAGLGLAIVKTIVTNHGGTIDVQSEPGAGACFEVRLPRP